MIWVWVDKTYTGSEMMFRFGCDINLIICQKSKVQDWVEHFNSNYGDKHIMVYDLTVPIALDTFLHTVIDAEMKWCKLIGVINYELVFRRKELLKLKDFCMVLDESSLIQNPSAKRTKFILKMKPKHCLMLSGSPVGGKYENLWTQLHLLGWDISLPLYEKQYVNWTLIEAGGFTHRIVDKENPYKNIDRLKRKMREYGAVFKKTDGCFKLPEQIFTKVQVKAPSLYWKFQKDSIVTFQDKEWSNQEVELVGDTSLTKLLYSRQICGQYCNDKLDAFEDLLNSTQERLIVFYNFDEELIRLKTICQNNGRFTSEINGHRKDLTAYEEDDSSVTLCQYQSASMGLNLQKCCRIVYFSLPLSSEHFEQSKKRIHRIGQEKTCFYYIMMCRGTVEEQILKTLEERRDFTDELFKMVEKNQKNKKEDSHHGD